MMAFAGHDAGPRGTAIENDFLSTLSVMRSRHLVRKSSTGEMRVRGIRTSLPVFCTALLTRDHCALRLGGELFLPTEGHRSC
jgi:hypothetical protein